MEFPFLKSSERIKKMISRCRGKKVAYKQGGVSHAKDKEGIWVALHSARRGMAHVEASRMSAHTH